jgi:manganese efflux pump family protein
MQPLEIVLIAVALAIDAFAVSLAAAAAGRVRGRRAAFRLAFHFGLFQFFMPVLGWAAGTTFAPLIAPFDHWVAFALLAVVAVRMLRAPGEDDAASSGDDPTRGVTLLVLATATSIDALAVGLSLAMLRVPVLLPSITIGVITAAISAGGIFLGGRMHVRFGRHAERFGGIILLLVALRIVASHTILGGG